MPYQMRMFLLMLAAGCGIALNFTLPEIGVPGVRRSVNSVPHHGLKY